MLTIRSIFSNLKKGQSALKVKDLFTKLDQTFESIKDRIKIVGCKKEPSKIIIYLTCPSEKEPRIVYNIVFELYTTEKLNLDTQFKVFSNSPNFGYNYAYLFNKLGSLLWPEKYPQDFIRIAPKTRNPFFFVSFDKHIYSCIKYISQYTLTAIIGEYDGMIPVIKSFQEKVREIDDVQEDIRRSQE
jgi:hypothetical protein